MFGRFDHAARATGAGCGGGFARGYGFGAGGGFGRGGGGAGFTRGRGLGGGGAGFRSGWGGRGARPFGHGGLRLLLLWLIAEKPRHGYELMKAVEDLAGGAYCPSPGVVYPTLAQLEEMAHVSVESAEGGRRLYRITPEGSAYLAANRAVVEAMLARTAEPRPASGLPALIVRALDGLRATLEERFARGGPTPEKEQAIAAAIDLAAAEARKE
jgi:DNA-binding PadR family transcriptional regulator